MNILAIYIKSYTRITAVLLALFITISCTEELSIADFEDDFKNYEVELRVEGVLDNTDFSKSIVRVDRTILVTDTSLFNGIDDNGDWEPYTDENGNGRWDEGEPLNDDIGVREGGPNGEYEGRGNGIPDEGEPNVDDYLEILPQIHDSTIVSVVLREAESQTFVADFIWSSRAASFDQNYGDKGPPSETEDDHYVTYYYGAYIPAPEYSQDTLNPELEYQIVLTTQDGTIISATTELVGPPVNLIWNNTVWDADTLIDSTNNYAYMYWNNSSETSFCAVLMDRVLGPDSTQSFYGSMAVAINRSEGTDLLEFQRNFIGVPLGLYKVRLESYSENYGSYIYSGLPLRDRELSTWRDQNGNVVIGALGAKTSIEFYLRLVSPILPNG